MGSDHKGKSSNADSHIPDTHCVPGPRCPGCLSSGSPSLPLRFTVTPHFSSLVICSKPLPLCVDLEGSRRPTNNTLSPFQVYPEERAQEAADRDQNISLEPNLGRSWWLRGLATVDSLILAPESTPRKPQPLCPGPAKWVRSQAYKWQARLEARAQDQKNLAKYAHFPATLHPHWQALLLQGNEGHTTAVQVTNHPSLPRIVSAWALKVPCPRQTRTVGHPRGFPHILLRSQTLSCHRARLFCSSRPTSTHHSFPGVCSPVGLVVIILIPSSLDSTSGETRLIFCESPDHPGQDKAAPGSLTPQTREQREVRPLSLVSQPVRAARPQTPAFLPRKCSSPKDKQ